MLQDPPYQEQPDQHSPDPTQFRSKTTHIVGSRQRDDASAPMMEWTTDHCERRALQPPESDQVEGVTPIKKIDRAVIAREQARTTNATVNSMRGSPTRRRQRRDCQLDRPTFQVQIQLLRSGRLSGRVVWGRVKTSRPMESSDRVDDGRGTVSVSRSSPTGRRQFRFREISSLRERRRDNRTREGATEPLTCLLVKRRRCKIVMSELTLPSRVTFPFRSRTQNGERREWRDTYSWTRRCDIVLSSRPLNIYLSIPSIVPTLHATFSRARLASFEFR